MVWNLEKSNFSCHRWYIFITLFFMKIECINKGMLETMSLEILSQLFATWNENLERLQQLNAYHSLSSIYPWTTGLESVSNTVCLAAFLFRFLIWNLTNLFHDIHFLSWGVLSRGMLIDNITKGKQLKEIKRLKHKLLRFYVALLSTTSK